MFWVLLEVLGAYMCYHGYLPTWILYSWLRQLTCLLATRGSCWVRESMRAYVDSASELSMEKRDNTWLYTRLYTWLYTWVYALVIRIVIHIVIHMVIRMLIHMVIHMVIRPISYTNIDLKLPIILHGPIYYKIGVTCVYNGHVIYNLMYYHDSLLHPPIANFSNVLLYGNIDQTLVQSLHRLLSCE